MRLAGPPEIPPTTRGPAPATMPPQRDTAHVTEVQQQTLSPLLSGPWSTEQIEEFLGSSIIPIRLATSGRSGPLVQSMWFLWRDGRLWCATQASAVVAQRLAGDPRCAFEVAGDVPPYRGVRGQGIAELIPEAGPQVLTALLQRYLGSTHSGLATWLLSRSETEVAIAIRPEHLTSWDFRRRMQE